MERKYGERRKNLSPCCHRILLLIQDFAVFDYLRGKFYTQDGTIKSKITLFFCGAIAGITALTCTTPLEFIR